MEHHVTSGKRTYALRSYQQNLFNYKITTVDEYSSQAFESLNSLMEVIVMNWETLDELTDESTDKVIDLHEMYALPHKVLLEMLLLANQLNADIVANIVGKILAYQIKNNTITELFSDL